MSNSLPFDPIPNYPIDYNSPPGAIKLMCSSEYTYWFEKSTILIENKKIMNNSYIMRDLFNYNSEKNYLANKISIDRRFQNLDIRCDVPNYFHPPLPHKSFKLIINNIPLVERFKKLLNDMLNPNTWETEDSPWTVATTLMLLCFLFTIIICLIVVGFRTKVCLEKRRRKHQRIKQAMLEEEELKKYNEMHQHHSHNHTDYDPTQHPHHQRLISPSEHYSNDPNHLPDHNTSISNNFHNISSINGGNTTTNAYHYDLNSKNATSGNINNPNNSKHTPHILDRITEVAEENSHRMKNIYEHEVRKSVDNLDNFGLPPETVQLMLPQNGITVSSINDGVSPNPQPISHNNYDQNNQPELEQGLYNNLQTNILSNRNSQTQNNTYNNTHVIPNHQDINLTNNFSNASTVLQNNPSRLHTPNNNLNSNLNSNSHQTYDITVNAANHNNTNGTNLNQLHSLNQNFSDPVNTAPFQSNDTDSSQQFVLPNSQNASRNSRSTNYVKNSPLTVNTVGNNMNDIEEDVFSYKMTDTYWKG